MCRSSMICDRQAKLGRPCLQRRLNIARRGEIVGSFLPKPRAFGEPATKCCDEGVVALAGLGACSGLSWLWQWWVGRQPKAHEDRQHFDRYTDIALHARQASVELVEAFRRRGFLRAGSGNLHSGDKWSFCLTSA